MIDSKTPGEAPERTFTYPRITADPQANAKTFVHRMQLPRFKPYKPLIQALGRSAKVAVAK
ncbi:hypothetical protein [Streptomyces sp. NPDC054834]